MANKKIFMGMLAGALALGMVLAGCENGVQEVEGKVNVTYPQVKAPTITETKTADGLYLILSWDAVENAGGYTVFQNQKDKKTVSPLTFSVSATNTIVYKVDGTTAPNADTDKWNARIPLQEGLGTSTTTEYRFGVSSDPIVLDSQVWRSSSIAWGAYTSTVLHPYTALLGTWIKEGSTTGPKFVIAVASSGGYPAEYTLYDATGTTQLDNSGFLTPNSPVVVFSGSYYSSSSYTLVSFAATLSAGTLAVTSLDVSLAGNYTKR